MNFKVAVAGLLAASRTVSVVSAFSPKPFGMENPSKLHLPPNDNNKNGKIDSSVVPPQNHPALWVPPTKSMKMVAGGAERAYGDDYYDGR